MEIINININEIKPYQNNPRENQNAIEDVINSISNYGFRVPLVLDIEQNIICGHTRYEAAKRLGYKELPCIIADDLNEEQVKAFRLIDNKVHDYSLWDVEKLFKELDKVDNLFTGMNFKENYELGNQLVEKLNIEKDDDEETEKEDGEEIYQIKFVIEDINKAETIYKALKEQCVNSEVSKLW